MKRSSRDWPGVMARGAGVVGLALIAAVVVVGLMLVLSAMVGCERRRTYSQATPDDVLASALAMVRENRTRELSTLVYADSAEMRFVLDRLGDLLGNMQELSRAAQERFPEDFARMRSEAEAAAASGKATTLIGAIVSSQGRGGRGRVGPDQARVLLNQVFADPYGWLETNAKRLTTIKPTDDTAYVLLDSQPAIPVIGLGMRQSGGKWYVALPTGVPPISGVWPRSREQWSILASIVKIVDRAVVEMTADIRAGNVEGLNALVDRASDKLLFPAGLAFVAYGKELDVRSKVDRRVAQFNRRLRAWTKERQQGGAEGSAGVAPELVEVLEAIAPAVIEKAVRRNTRPTFEEMSNPQFEETVRGWLSEQGLSVDFSGDLASQSVPEAIARWRGEKK